MISSRLEAKGSIAILSRSNSANHASIEDEAFERRNLVAVALGRRPADTVIFGGRLVNVYTGEIEDDCSIAISGKKIAAVGDCRKCVGPGTKVVDAKGTFLVPGLVDAHYHIESSRLSPWRHAEVTLPRGLTTLVEDPHECCASGGLDAIRYMLEASLDLPQKVYVQVSSATPPSNIETTGGYISGDEAKEAFSWPRVMGLGEMMDPQRFFEGDERQWSLIRAALACREPIEGHGGYSGSRLSAYADAGVRSTHSPNEPSMALEMLKRGFDIQLKVEREVETLRLLQRSHVDWGSIGLAVDDRPVQKLLDVGSLDNEMRQAIRMGIPPVRACQMATLNNARHWRIERDHGGIAPGRYADILVVDDLKDFSIVSVICNGKEVAKEGTLLEPIEPHPAPSYAKDTIHLKHLLSTGDMTLPTPISASPDGSVRAIVLPPYLWTGDVAEIIQNLPAQDGHVCADPAHGINKVAVVERHKSTGNIGIGFYQYGIMKGAVATSVMHDSHNIAVVGANDGDMVLAANRVAQMQGGIAVTCGGQVLAELPLPVFGMMSDDSPSEVARRYLAVEEAARSLREGSDEVMPLDKMSPTLRESLKTGPVDHLTFAFLTCHPRRYVLTDRGLFDMFGEKRLNVVL